MRAFVDLLNRPPYRRDAFAAGLHALGYRITTHPGAIAPADLYVTWNRRHERLPAAYEAAGARVVVVENGYFGREWRGGTWYAMALGQHNGAGRWKVGGPERWASWGVELAPLRTEGEVVLLPQRGIGSAVTAMPRWWVEGMIAKMKRAGIACRVRVHPGINPCLPLEEDLRHAGKVLTWGSGAALKAMVLGIPAFSDFPQWIGRPAAGDMDTLELPPDRRLPMFERLAWAMWRLDEIESGKAFRTLLA